MGGVIAIAALSLTACAAGRADLDRMVFTGAGGSYQEAQTIAFIEPFMAETKIKVVQDQPYSLAKVKTMVESGRTTWDVMEVDPYLAMGENCGKYFEVIDTSKIDTTGVDQDLITECSMPDMKSAYLFVYNRTSTQSTDLVEGLLRHEEFPRQARNHGLRPGCAGDRARGGTGSTRRISTRSTTIARPPSWTPFAATPRS